MVVVMLLVVLDSLTTKYIHRGFLALRRWAGDNAPSSFLVMMGLIVAVYCACLPWGPLVFGLAYLMGELRVLC